MTHLLQEKKGLIIGVANERSIAWGIARELSNQGAEIALNYQNEGLAKRVIPLGESINSKIIMQADATDADSLDKLFAQINQTWGQLDFLVHAIAFSDKSELTGKFINTSQENFLLSLNVSCYSFIDLARRAVPLMKKGGSIMTLTYMGANRVTPNYNVMGVAKAALESTVRYLANDLGPLNIRVNAISPGPMKTLAGAAIGSARKTYRHTEANAPLGMNPTQEHVGGTAVYLVSDYGASTTGEVIRVDGGFHVLGMPQLNFL